MTTLHDQNNGSNDERNEAVFSDEPVTTMRIGPATLQKSGLQKSGPEKNGSERRRHRRHDMAQQGISVDRWDNKRRVGRAFGEIVDISAGGVRIRATDGADVKPDGQIRIRLELPDYAGISPFIDNTGTNLEPKREWIGWMAVARVQKIDGNEVDIAGRLIDMDEIDRGMLGLYLSTQPLAA